VADTAMRVTVRAKILALALTLVLLLSAAAAHSLYRSRQIEAELRALTEIFVPLDDQFARLALLSVERDLTYRHLLAVAEGHEETPPATLQAALDEEVSAIAAVLAELDRLFADAQRRPVASETAAVLEVVEEAVAELVAEAAEHGEAAAAIQLALAEGQPPPAAAEKLIGHGHNVASSVNVAMRALVELTEAVGMAAERHQHRALVVGSALVLAALVLAVWLSALLSGGITRPLARLVRGAEAVSAGDLDVTVPPTSRDEVGDLATAFNGMVAGLRLKERIESTFGRYMDPRIVQELVDDPDSVSRTERREMTVSFVDMAGFTSLTETMPADELVHFLNTFFSHMTAPVAARNGVIDAFIGDAVMSYFGPPFSAPDEHAAAACLAALDQLACLEAFNAEFPALPDVSIRIGIATGEVVAGSIGSEALRSYTVVGDRVNLASRLEALNKTYGTQLLISERTRELAGDAIEVREVDRVAVRGRHEESTVYEVLAPAE
jgi:class 3 adenylate cyclase